MDIEGTPTAASNRAVEITETVRSLRTAQPSRNQFQYLTAAEADQINDQFSNTVFRPGGQVMWSGVPREWAQAWADNNNMQTLTTVMGPLMDKEHSSCLKSTKSAKEWSIYIKGASELYALHIPKGNVITVLTRPPPQRLNPTGKSTYQALEEPILKGREGGEPVSRVEMVHLTVADAQQFRYQVWPIDKIHEWIEKFGLHSLIRPSSAKTKKSTQQATESDSKPKVTILNKSRQEKGKQIDPTKAEVKQERAKEEKDEEENGGHEAYSLGNIEQMAAMQTSSIQEKAVQKETNKVNMAEKDEAKKAKRKGKKQRTEPSEKLMARQPAAKDHTTRQVLTEERMLGGEVSSLEKAAAQIIPVPSEVTKSRGAKTLTLRNRVVVCRW